MGILLNFNVSGNTISRLDSNRLSGNSIGFVTAKFTFDDTWDAVHYTTTALFENSSGHNYAVILYVIDGEADCSVPYEALSVDESEGSYFYVSVRGVITSGNTTTLRATANKVLIKLEANGSLTDENSGTATATIPEQVAAALAKSQWKTGTAVTGTGTCVTVGVADAVVGMHYINTDTSNVYVCTAVDGNASAWDYVCSFKGTQGAQGNPMKQIRTTGQLNGWINSLTAPENCIITTHSVVYNDITLNEGSVYLYNTNTHTLTEAYSTIGADGADGADGEDGNGISSAVLNADYTLTLTFTDGTSYTTPSIRGEQGSTGSAGATGNGISSIAKTSTAGKVDTYTITFTNGNTTTFTVTNGNDGINGTNGAAGADAKINGVNTLTMLQGSNISLEQSGSNLTVSALSDVTSVNGYDGDVVLDYDDVGAISALSKGASNGVAELDANGKVPSAQLPSYVDDVLEYASQSSFPQTGEAGKIYIAQDTNKTYRWSGSAYVEISASLALGETSSTAYRGDRGATAYSHSQDGAVHITIVDRISWNGKYTVPNGGIPSSDMTQAIQDDFDFLDSHETVVTEGSSNLITSGGVYDAVHAVEVAKQNSTDNSLSTTSKTVVGAINEVNSNLGNKEATANKVTSISSASTNTQYPSALAVYNFIQSLDGNGVAY